MRISSIKLAGFKSFVDPTTLSLPGNLTGIVGPNGCGKSNVIDALQWVLGESSAKHLRGDSMADVIFNGSSTRKPVGQASVEIIFDNGDGGLGGQWASFGEISIKRLVNRDGVSAYYLNGTRCRRRDVTDLFLGTGLGSHGYSVIAQGMISRIVEAKPEDLRLFLEEAAGISKYKERRRETESRIQKTHENLTRLQDIRDELEKHLSRLQQQARAAEKYQTLKDDERRVRADLLALAWRDVQRESEQQVQLTQQRETAVEAALARLRAVEAQLERDRQAHMQASEQFNEVQARYYAAGAEIARIEQGIEHARERRSALERDLTQAQHDLDTAHAHVAQDRQELERTAEAIRAVEPNEKNWAAREAAHNEQLAQAEQAMQAWQAEWDNFNALASASLRDEHGQQTHIEHLTSGISRLEQRCLALRTELDGLAITELEQSVETLAAFHVDSNEAVQALHEQRAQVQAQVRDLRTELEAARNDADARRGELQTLRGRLASLEALQQAAYGADQETLQEWLRQRQLNTRPRLAEEMAVDSDWETAVETVLGSFLEGLLTDELQAYAADVAQIPAGIVTLLESGGDSAAVQPARLTLPLLTDKVQSACALAGLLQGTYTAQTLEEAWPLRAQLLPEESIIVRDGTWIGRNWLQVARTADAKAGVLKREKEIKALRRQEREAAVHLETLETRIEQIRGEYEDAVQRDEALQHALADKQSALGQLVMELANQRAQLDQVVRRRGQIDSEIAELAERIRTDQGDLQNAQQVLGSLRNSIETGEARRNALVGQRDQLREHLQAARDGWRSTREEAHALALRLESMRSQKQALETALARNIEAAAHLERRVQDLREALAQSDAPLAALQTELDAALQRRVGVETELTAARAALQELEARLREAEQQRNSFEQEAQSAREELEQARMAAQGYEIRLQHYQEQLAASNFELQTLLTELPEDTEKSDWEQRLGSIERAIARLGPINLAAIDECNALSERKTYLDSQHADLTEALNTLETAIRQIDQETRARFTETFEKVNDGFKIKFPQLFGGGQAALELTGEDLLETGVTVIARPPGKRNSTIHLLSGGEKALTAVALIFSIFDLNPAPFCLLDEVDAPLDDANVVHFCDMVKEMSSQVQFLFITHNKITMEIASRLVGVTMHEPGVSRLVAVDVDDAVRLVATA